LLRTLREGLTTVAPPAKERFRSETIDYHERILEAIKQGDPARARDLMYRHLVQIGEVVKSDDFGEGSKGVTQGRGRRKKPSPGTSTADTI
jgi:DNA-binding GntR family transcriptional regulator